MDIVVTSLGGEPLVLLNHGGSGNWLSISLRGTRSNRDGLGASVQVNGQKRFATTAGSYISASDKRLHFGLGATPKWPKWRFTGPRASIRSLERGVVLNLGLCRSARTGEIMIGALLSALLALQASGSPALQHVHAGVDAEKSGQLDAALAEFQKATELDPKLAIAFADLGGVYIEKRDYAAAIPPLKRAVELSPNLEAAHRLLGYALLAQGYATEAIPHLERGRMPRMRF